MDIFDQIYFKERPISLPIVTMSTKNEYMINEIMGENSTKSKYMKNLMNNQNIMLGYPPPYQKLENQKMSSN